MNCRSRRERKSSSRATNEELPTCAHGMRFPVRRRPKPERSLNGKRVSLRNAKEKRYAELFMAGCYWVGGAGNDVPPGNGGKAVRQSGTERGIDCLWLSRKARPHRTWHGGVPALRKLPNAFA